MKTLFPYIFFLALVACGEPDTKPTEINGCQSGNNPSGDWVFIRCRTRGEAQADGNSLSVYNGPNATPQFTVYKNVKWEACSTCK